MYGLNKHKALYKSHLELQREITLIEVAPSPYFFVKSIRLAYMNIFAKFDENPAITLQVIKKTKRYGRTDARTDGRTTLYRQSIKLFYQKLWLELVGPCMD